MIKNYRFKGFYRFSILKKWFFFKQTTCFRNRKGSFMAPESLMVSLSGFLKPIISYKYHFDKIIIFVVSNRNCEPTDYKIVLKLCFWFIGVLEGVTHYHYVRWAGSTSPQFYNMRTCSFFSEISIRWFDTQLIVK